MTATWSARCPAIHCEGCVNSIKRSLGRLAGVQQVEVEVPQKRVSIQYDSAQVTEAMLRERLDLAGFGVE
jgi:copper chaperone CopZ